MDIHIAGFVGSGSRFTVFLMRLEPFRFNKLKLLVDVKA
jgi:hypothetical protein